MIGIFDSGSGGLTVLRAIRDRLPSADILYYGDIRNAPYGTRPHEELSVLTIDAMRFLHSHGAHSIVSACNSVSAALAVSLFDTLSIEPARLIEMVGPTVSMFRDSPARIFLVATPATVRSGIYQNGFRMIGKEVTVLPIEKLAEMIERGESQPEIEHYVRNVFTMTPYLEHDALILACTHYPLVRDVFQRIVGDEIAIIDPADAVAARAEARFWPREAGSGTVRFAITQDSAVFRGLVARLFPEAQYSIDVV